MIRKRSVSLTQVEASPHIIIKIIIFFENMDCKKNRFLQNLLILYFSKKDLLARENSFHIKYLHLFFFSSLLFFSCLTFNPLPLCFFLLLSVVNEMQTFNQIHALLKDIFTNLSNKYADMQKT